MSASRRDLLRRLAREIRDLAAASELLQAEMARLVDLNRTDLRALDAITRERGVTAGRLAGELHLTTGAVTGVLDRLERAGHVRRATDAADRRRVVVHPTATALAAADGLVQGVREDLQQLATAYSDAEIDRVIALLAGARGSLTERARELAARSAPAAADPLEN